LEHTDLRAAAEYNEEEFVKEELIKQECD